MADTMVTSKTLGHFWENLNEHVLPKYVEKGEDGAGLSDNNFTDDYKQKLDDLDTTIDDAIADATIEADKISGVLDISNIPQAALERVYKTTDKEAMLKLTKENVQNGDTVQLTDGSLYMVVNDEQLSTDGSTPGQETAFMAYTASTATKALTADSATTADSADSVEWTGVQNVPLMTEDDIDEMMGLKEVD